MEASFSEMPEVIAGHAEAWEGCVADTVEITRPM